MQINDFRFIYGTEYMICTDCRKLYPIDKLTAYRDEYPGSYRTRYACPDCFIKIYAYSVPKQPESEIEVPVKKSLFDKIFRR